MDKLLDFGFLSGVDLWRSEEMMLSQLMIPAESAHGAVAALGDIGVLQFKDLNADKSAFQRTYANQVKRCDEMSRRLRFFHEQLDKAGIVVKPRPLGIDQENKHQFDELEAKLESLETEMNQMLSNNDKLQRSAAELNELQTVLEKAGTFFNQKGGRYDVGAENFFRSPAENPAMPLLETGTKDDAGPEPTSRIGFVAGTVQQEKLGPFERLLFRATRGNVYLRQMAIGKVRDPASGEEVLKSVFVIFYAGDRAKDKVSRICDAFQANRYPFPDDVSKQRSVHANVTERLRELSTTNSAGERRRDALYMDLASQLDSWSSIVRREKAIYHTLNKFSIDVTSKVLVAEAWVPVASKSQVHDVLKAAAAKSSTQKKSNKKKKLKSQALDVLRLAAVKSSIQLSGVLQPLATTDAPPTHYTTNKFTECFQNIVDSYGIARYREVNPAVLTIMTFPFLFAVMFGDLGHGAILLAVAGYMIYHEKAMEKQDLGDMIGMLFGGRYCILLMALFSCYTGLIYNEFFSMPMAIFGATNWQCMSQVNGTILDVDVRDCSFNEGKMFWGYGQQPYVFGVDPVWHGTKTELPYFNSVKMKMSIVLGVTHMNFGIVMSLFNNVFFRDHLSTIWEFIPQMIFLNFIFGYLVILIIAKWMTGSMSDLYNVTEGNGIFDAQESLQKFLLAVALIAVPCMLLPKPLILKKRHEASQKALGATRHVQLAQYDHHDTEAVAPKAAAPAHGGGGHGHGEFDFGEIMVHQMIHTIEFVLGAVSNTASYLRLWLSSVFYDRVLMAAIAANSPLAIVIGFFVFFCATMGVLMVMESLSAFLHALRLHWVEFMNKFYKGDGYKFTPFCFKAIEEAELTAEKP
eukprot:gene9116-16238_t